ncbi:Uncharacterised protein [Vibrio cholerae]|nr:Uncharacterised protein [Vibrio cholerae]
MTHRFFINAAANQSVIHIGESHQAGTQRNIVAFES